jgi:hypothetical protein
VREPGSDALALLARPAWHDVWVGALAQWLIFVPLLSVLLALSGIAFSVPNGPFFALFSPIYSAVVGAVVTIVLGVPLAKALSVLLGRSTAWVAHLVAYLGLGFVLAALLIHLWMLATGLLWDSTAWWTSMWLFLPIASAAALSVGAGWGIAWRRAVVRHRALPILEESYA